MTPRQCFHARAVARAFNLLTALLGLPARPASPQEVVSDVGPNPGGSFLPFRVLLLGTSPSRSPPRSPGVGQGWANADETKAGVDLRSSSTLELSSLTLPSDLLIAAEATSATQPVLSCDRTPRPGGTSTRRDGADTTSFVPYTRPEHTNSLELRAVHPALRWRSRSVRHLRRHLLHLAYCQITMGARTKGRSSSPAGCHVLRAFMLSLYGLFHMNGTRRTVSPEATTPSALVRRRALLHLAVGLF